MPPSQLDRLRAALSGRYVVERELGMGGMATVYLAQDLRHQRQVAIKVMRPELAASLGPGRFLREIQFAAALQHPHILPVYDSGETDGLLYYVMPYVEGESLQQRLRREGQLPLGDAIQILGEVADALGFAHSRNVVHRDVKPANILLHGGHAMVADFGIARAIEAAGGEQLTQTGIAIGTPAYMSPEQASADSKIDGRSDVYSLGCVFYEMLGGEPPHTGPSPQAILARQLSGEVRSLRPLRDAVTPALDQVIRRALARSPADRYPTAAEFTAAVNAALAGGTGAEPRVAWPRWARLVPALGAVAVLAVAAYLIWGVPNAVSAEPGPGVAVFPFRPTSPGAGEWSEAVGDLLATALDGTPGVRVADPWSLWQSLRPERGARAEAPDPEEADRLAREAHAGFFLLGSVLENQGRLDLTLRVYQAGASDALHTLSAAAPAESLTTVAQRLAVGVIEWIWSERRDSTPRVRDLEGYTTRVPAALKAYLQAKEAMRRGQVDEANTAIDRALGLDSAFALALLEAAIIKSWWQQMQGRPFAGLRELVQRAGRYADSLSPRNQLRATAIAASIETDGAQAAGALSRIVQLDSTDFEAWIALAYVHQTYGWQYRKGPADAEAALERAIRLDPGYVPALASRAWVAVAGGDRDDLRHQLDRLRQADSGSMLVRGSRLGINALLRDDAGFPPFADSVARRPREEWIAVLRALRVTNPPRAESLLVRVERSAVDGAVGLGELARLEIAEGRTAAVDSGIAAGAYGPSGRLLQFLLVAAGLPDLSDSLASWRAVRALEQYLPPDSALAYFDSRAAWQAAWLLGAWHAQRGDTSRARRWYRVIGTFPSGGSPPQWREALQSDLEARLAGRRGDRDAALRWAGRALEQWTVHSENQFENSPEPQMRLHLALLLRAAGRADSAEALLRSLVPPTTWMGFLTARAWYELGELAEASGDYRAAADRYDRALRLWNGGGPEIRDWRARAQQGLERVLRRVG